MKAKKNINRRRQQLIAGAALMAATIVGGRVATAGDSSFMITWSV